MIVTLHEPSNGAADAVVGAEMAVIAKAVASVTARREELIIGDPRVGLEVALRSWRLRPIDGARLWLLHLS
jgi:hypothetical protein